MSKQLDQQIFERAYELVKTRWCRCNRAMTKDNRPTDSWSPNAEKFCVFGAIDRAFFEALGWQNSLMIDGTYPPAYHKIVTRLRKAGEQLFPKFTAGWTGSNYFSLMGINDALDGPDYGQKGVIKIFEEAAKDHD